MAQYETKAFEALSKTKAEAKAQAKGKASGSTQAKPKPKAKAKAKGKASAHQKVLKRPSAQGHRSKTSGNPEQYGHYQYPGPKGPFGCIRCRGNVKGCEKCIQPDFAGFRFSSRANSGKPGKWPMMATCRPKPKPTGQAICWGGKEISNVPLAKETLEYDQHVEPHPLEKSTSTKLSERTFGFPCQAGRQNQP